MNGDLLRQYRRQMDHRAIDTTLSDLAIMGASKIKGLNSGRMTIQGATDYVLAAKKSYQLTEQESFTLMSSLMNIARIGV